MRRTIRQIEYVIKPRKRQRRRVVIVIISGLLRTLEVSGCIRAAAVGDEAHCGFVGRRWWRRILYLSVAVSEWGKGRACGDEMSWLAGWLAQY